MDELPPEEYAQFLVKWAVTVNWPQRNGEIRDTSMYDDTYCLQVIGATGALVHLKVHESTTIIYVSAEYLVIHYRRQFPRPMMRRFFINEEIWVEQYPYIVYPPYYIY